MRRLFARPLRLTLGGSLLRFDARADFAFAIAGRTAVPAQRVNELLLRPLSELESEMQNLANLDSRLANILRQSDAGEASCADAIARVGVQIFSKDHEWRPIVEQLLGVERYRDECMALAVATYRQYVAARLAIVRTLLEVRRQAPTPIAAAMAESALETGIFSVDDHLALLNDTSLRRLPQGEAVRLRLASGAVIPIKLARHQFSLAHERHWTLIADDGQRFALHDGFNSVGRSHDNDVALGASFRNVSRKHLLVKTLGNDAVELTDISSFGTYIPPAAIAS